jgi:protein-S-isoprenylcysteine O-methyltransferase Ste14
LRIFRHILGFTVGLGMFAVVVPLGLYYLSQAIDQSLGLERFGPLIVRLILGLPFLLVGIFFVLWSNFFLVTRGEGGPADGFGVAISPRSQKLVVTGPYRYTRNPMVFGALSSYLALCLLLGSFGGLAALAVFVPLAVRYLKLTEEKRLARDFGEEFEAYRRAVSMVIPLPPGKQ